jgi:type I site-specific restriction-modification system R (restriction) subunit
MALPEREAHTLWEQVQAEFGERYLKIGEFLRRWFERVRPCLHTDEKLSAVRKSWLGAYFSHEYSLEAAALEKIVGSEKCIELIAAGFVKHWEARLEAMETQAPYGGKAMIVCMSRRICVELYEEIRKLKPEWHSDNDKQGVMKVVMTGAADDPAEWQCHIQSKDRRPRQPVP